MTLTRELKKILNNYLKNPDTELSDFIEKNKIKITQNFSLLLDTALQDMSKRQSSRKLARYVSALYRELSSEVYKARERARYTTRKDSIQERLRENSRQYYATHKSEILVKKKHRYNTDQDFREAQIARVQKLKNSKKQK